MKRLLLALAIVVCALSFMHSNSSFNTMNQSNHADLVVFSYDRPLQLYAFLESVYKYITDIHDIHVVYRCSSAAYDQGYTIVKEDFPSVVFHKQNNIADFKHLTLKASFQSSSKYILFAVDDIIIKDSVNISYCIDALERYSAYGFYLRLGKNLTHCYSWGSIAQPLPPLQKEEDDIYSWQFKYGKFDWNYLNTVDMTLYRKKDVYDDFYLFNYANPNKLEDIWNIKGQRAKGDRIGLCFTDSKIVNLPLNRVQHDYNNRAMQEWKVNDLLAIFIEGKKMDIEPLSKVKNQAAHMEYSPQFITR